MRRRCAIASDEGATNARKSAVFIHGGTARTATVVQSWLAMSAEGPSAALRCWCSALDGWDALELEAPSFVSCCRFPSRKMWMMPSGRLVLPSVDLGDSINVAMGVARLYKQLNCQWNKNI